MHTGSLNPGVNSDFRDIPTPMGEVVQSQSAHNLNQTIEDIAKLWKPKFDATGPAADND